MDINWNKVIEDVTPVKIMSNFEILNCYKNICEPLDGKFKNEDFIKWQHKLISEGINRGLFMVNYDEKN